MVRGADLLDGTPIYDIKPYLAYTDCHTDAICGFADAHKDDSIKVDFNEGLLFQKVNQIVSLLIPMFVISFQRAEDLANAMEARGYIVDGKRTKLDELKIKPIDIIASLVILVLISNSV